MVTAPRTTTAADPAPSSLDAGRLLFGLGGLVLLVSLFLDWYGADRESVSAWTAFEIVDLLLATIALAALAWVLAELSGRRVPDLSQAMAMGIAVATLAIVVVNLIDPPPALFGGDPDVGAWMALGAAIAMTIGALMGSTAISITVARRERPAARAVDPDAETRTFGPP
jgi:hypothetical protein